jgi:hypothetical protein
MNPRSNVVLATTPSNKHRFTYAWGMHMVPEKSAQTSLSLRHVIFAAFRRQPVKEIKKTRTAQAARVTLTKLNTP